MLAIAACLRRIALDLENGTAEGFEPSCGAVEALETGSEHDPRTEEGFRSWMDYFGELSSEDIEAEVQRLRGGGRAKRVVVRMVQVVTVFASLDDAARAMQSSGRVHRGSNVRIAARILSPERNEQRDILLQEFFPWPKFARLLERGANLVEVDEALFAEMTRRDAGSSFRSTEPADVDPLEEGPPLSEMEAWALSMHESSEFVASAYDKLVLSQLHAALLLELCHRGHRGMAEDVYRILNA